MLEINLFTISIKSVVIFFEFHSFAFAVPVISELILPVDSEGSVNVELAHVWHQVVHVVGAFYLANFGILGLLLHHGLLCLGERLHSVAIVVVLVLGLRLVSLVLLFVE